MSRPIAAEERLGVADQASHGFVALAKQWVARSCGVGGAEWFGLSLANIGRRDDGDALPTAIGLAPRKLGKLDLALSTEEITEARGLRKGLDPSNWSVDQLARIAFMVAAYDGDDETFAGRFDTFCATAEINELIALYCGLPVYPAARLLEPRAREAVRSGMRPVFESVAQRNPYPVEYFDEHAWNHMVVKAMFMASSLWPIQGLDLRANPRLARMLVDLAQERWAAGRAVSAEIWRCVAPFADDEGEKALVRALSIAEGRDLLAVVTALEQAPAEMSERVVATSGKEAEVARRRSELAASPLDWKTFG
jgi:hypothetical protein